MNRVIYYLLTAPFFFPVKMFEFFVWEIVSTGRKRRFHSSNHASNQELSNYILFLLGQLDEEKERADDLHDYYGRQLKQKDSEINRMNRLN